MKKVSLATMSLCAVSILSLSSAALADQGRGGPQNPPAPATGQPAPSCIPVTGPDALREIRFHAMQPGVCLRGFNRWGDDDRDGWGREEHRHDGVFVDFDVEPDCDNFNVCENRFYNPGPQPADTGSTRTQILDSSAPFSSAAGQSFHITMQNPESLITTAYNLVNQSEVSCIRPGQAYPIYAQAEGHGVFVETHADCSVARTDFHTFRGMPGYQLDTLTPQVWQENDITQQIHMYTTDLTVNVQPVDFPDAYPISGTISLSQGQGATISAESKYFVHTAEVVRQHQDNEYHGTQVINLVSTIRPILAPNDISVGYDGHGVLTIRDADIAELAHIDANNRATYNIAAYVNWNRTFGHEKFGNVLAGRPEAIVSNNVRGELQVNLNSALMANGNYKKQLSDGSKDWAIYLEITTIRGNKYVLPDATQTLVYEIKIGKKFKMDQDAISPWNDPSKYR